jgi:hypothetical protein
MNLVPGVRAVAGALRPAHSLALLNRYTANEETSQTLARLSGARIVDIQERAVDLDGAVTTASRTVAREPGGDYLIAIYDSTLDADVVFDPPLLSLPAGLGRGKSWSSDGLVNAVLHYRSAGRVVDAGPRETAVGKFEDCLAVETRLALSNDAQTFETVATDWLCAGAGHVATQEFDSGGAVVMRHEVVSIPDRPVDPALLPPPARASQPRPDELLADWRAWRLSRFAEAALTGGEIESSIAPVWIPADPPVVLMAAYNSDLLAFDPTSTISGTLWRFHTAGTIYGPPAFDAARGRLYFGSTDKRLHALDARGLFLWSVKTGDNVATRPVVASAGGNPIVIFGSEDRNVYGVSADAGRLRWSFAAGAAVVSSPALFGQGSGQLAIIG